MQRSLWVTHRSGVLRANIRSYRSHTGNMNISRFSLLFYRQCLRQSALQVFQSKCQTIILI